MYLCPAWIGHKVLDITFALFYLKLYSLVRRICGYFHLLALAFFYVDLH